jgi:hypothetical protein
MTADQLRSLRDATPFRPFVIHLADGRTHRVIHRDFLLLSPGGRTAIIYRNDEAFSIVDVLLITELEPETFAANPSAPAGDAT